MITKVPSHKLCTVFIHCTCGNYYVLCLSSVTIATIFSSPNSGGSQGDRGLMGQQ